MFIIGQMTSKPFLRIGIDARLWNETGVGRYIRNLVQNLAEIDTHNHYILFLCEKEFHSLGLPGKNFEKRLADFRWHSLEEQYRFPHILAVEKLDLIHFPYFSFPFFYRGKFILTIHDLILHHFPTGKASTLPLFYYKAKLLAYKFLLASGVKRAKSVLTVSQATKREITNIFHVPEEKIAVTYEGVDRTIQPSLFKKIHSESVFREKYFLYVGNAYPHKNLERMLDGFVLFRERITENIRLLLVGREDYFYKRLEKKIKEMGLTESVSVRHHIEDSELGDLYARALGLIVPSLMEGFGLPALEAMSRDCLVLASDIPVMREVCKDAAVYFDPYDESSIADALTEVYDCPNDFAGYKKAGRRRIRDFSWKAMAEETLKVYKEVVLS